ncbi:MAG: hypothetical protein AB7N76_25590 [Planctomycetota bacterium]
MISSDVEAAELNRVRWRGRGHRRHYEVWYLTLHDASGEAFWLRYTLHLPADPSQPGEAGLWAFSFAPDGSGLELRDVYAVDRFRDRSREGGAFQLGLGPATLGAEGAAGEVGSGERRIAWELRFDDARGSFRYLPPGIYGVGLAGSCVSTPRQALRVSGAIEIGGRRVELRDAHAEQGHVFGHRHADAWTWAQCHAFQGGVEGAFEGVCARVRRAGLTIQGSPLGLRVGGRELAWNGLRTMWSPECTFELGRWRFEARQGKQLLRGEVTAPLESFVSVEYADPDGTRAYCNHSEHASLRLERCERRVGAWEVQETLRAERAVAFEVAGRERDPRVARRLDLADARRLD